MKRIGIGRIAFLSALIGLTCSTGVSNCANISKSEDAAIFAGG